MTNKPTIYRAVIHRTEVEVPRSLYAAVCDRQDYKDTMSRAGGHVGRSGADVGPDASVSVKLWAESYNQSNCDAFAVEWIEFFVEEEKRRETEAANTTKRTIYFCKNENCRSTDLFRDAFVAINFPDDEPNTYDDVSCSGCGYDGHYYLQADVTQEQFDEYIDAGYVPEAVQGEETTL
ncbi:MAG: hypothetical protein RBU21_02970 [FCB group bacterium]|jgi:hypothetical protein|nr:hypothetical protein [FCB group bacterium]